MRTIDADKQKEELVKRMMADIVTPIVVSQPSVHPDYDCVLKQFGDCTYDTTGCSDCVIKAKIKAALSAQPEIIRCKDCKFYVPMIRKTEGGICYLLMHHFGDNWYCAGAERRTDG